MFRNAILVATFVSIGSFLAACDTTVPVVASGGISLTNQQVAPPAYMPGTVLDEKFMRSVRNGG